MVVFSTLSIESNNTRSALAKIEVGQRHLYPDEIILLKRILNTTYEMIFHMEEP